MNFRTNDWLKKLNTNPSGAQPPQNQYTRPSGAGRRRYEDYFPTPLPTPNLATLGVSNLKNPIQQMTGRVGGIQTTAQQTQPLSAQLGGWFGQSAEKKNLNPLETVISWLLPYLKTGTKNIQSWTQGLPQNITSELLGRKVKKQSTGQPLGFPQTDIAYRTEQLVSQGIPRGQAEVMALQEAEIARRQELSKFPASIPKRVSAGAKYLKQR